MLRPSVQSIQFINRKRAKNLLLALAGSVCLHPLVNSQAFGVVQNPGSSLPSLIEMQSTNPESIVRSEWVTMKAPPKGKTLKERAYAAMNRAQPFFEFFKTVDERILERNYVIRAFMLGILTKEHVLLMGPPGNAKTMIVDDIFKNIMEPMIRRDNSAEEGAEFSVERDMAQFEGEDTALIDSAFAMQLTKESTLAETHGSIDLKALQEEGKRKRFYEQGTLGFTFAFWDEVFDQSKSSFRNTLGVLAERRHTEGGETFEGQTKTVAAATNRYIVDVLKAFDFQGEPIAMLDRFSLSMLIPKDFEKWKNYKKLFHGIDQKEFPLLTTHDITYIQNLIGDVEIPSDVEDYAIAMHYKLDPILTGLAETKVKEYYQKIASGENMVDPPYWPTKFFSNRTLYKASKFLRAFAVLRWLDNGDPDAPIKANMDDVKNLELFYTLGGPEDHFIEKSAIHRASTAAERSQYATIQTEREVFRTVYEELLSEGEKAKDLTAKYDFPNRFNAYINGSLTRQEIVELAVDLIFVAKVSDPTRWEEHDAIDVSPVELKLAQVHRQTLNILEVMQIDTSNLDAIDEELSELLEEPEKIDAYFDGTN